mmetsp:Transcript_26771/g.82355  ORF Transcript_26771/g.82355 Transcript_26771/m.82355 type:complete len:211 (+) Transcript_26771:3-635(+)
MVALGWACWKTYAGQPEAVRCMAMVILGTSLRETRPDEALPVVEATLALKLRYFSHNDDLVFDTQCTLASCLDDLGRYGEALALKREVFAKIVASLGISDACTLMSGNNLVVSLNRMRLWEEAQTLVRDQLLPVARRTLGPDHDVTLRLNHNLAEAIRTKPGFNRDDFLEAETIMRDVVQRRRRVFGSVHPSTLSAERGLSIVRQKLATR